MDFAAVIAQLNDLPTAFQRGGPPYTQIVDALAAETTLYTSGVDSIVSQLTFATALDGWLDVWGLIFDIPRQQNEANSKYQTRISETILAWIGTVPALQVWLNLFAPGGTITENLPGVGYAISLPANLSSSQITTFFTTLARIRPAGVPFTVNQLAGGLYLGTINFLGEGRMQGAYLATGISTPVYTLKAYTNNAAPQLPDLYFVDPTLNT